MIALVGMPAAGKSSVGVVVATRLGLTFADSDEVLARRFGDVLGPDPGPSEWSTFRSREAQVLDDLARTGGVVAVGGGAWADARTRRAFAPWRTVYLRVTVEDLVRRNVAAGRVMFAGVDDVPARLRNLLESREPDYRMADVTVDARESVDAVAAAVVASLYNSEVVRADAGV